MIRAFACKMQHGSCISCGRNSRGKHEVCSLNFRMTDAVQGAYLM